MEINVNHKNGISKETHLFGYKYNLYQESNQIEAYRDLFITDINALENTVSFSNGFVLHPGESVCDILEEDKRHIQIRETILSHLNRENELSRKELKYSHCSSSMRSLIIANMTISENPFSENMV